MTKKLDIKTSADIRNFLLEQMGKVADGEQDVLAAKAVCNYAQQIYNTVNLEVKLAIAKEKSKGDLNLKPVRFDNEDRD